MPYCLIFPGQGTQFQGMSAGLDLQWTGDGPLIELMENGPEDVLRQTANAQKAVFAVTACLWKKSGLDLPEMAMGHSLGEYMALTASGAVSVQECYTLVEKRARAMQEAMPPGTGAMAAVLGMSAVDVAGVIEPVSHVWVANINTKDQVVISGDASSVKDASSLLKERGARKVVPLNVAVASHCPRMEPARKVLQEHLQKVGIREPRARIVFNATAQEESEPEAIKDLLAQQLVSPVQWESSVRYAAGRGIDRFIEIGPKSVLAPMVKRIVPGAKVEVITPREH
jgi:[acyl-carrier-protein] S-malonyltransferase